MIHVLDLVNWLLEARPIYTYTLGSSKITKNSKFKKNSFVVTLLEYPNNIIVKLTANAVASYEHFHELKIFTENKTYQNLLHGKFQITKGNIKEIKNKYPDKSNRKKLIRNFIDCICNPKLKPLISKKEQFDLMKICFAIDKSIKIKKKIFIRYD